MNSINKPQPHTLLASLLRWIVNFVYRQIKHNKVSAVDTINNAYIYIYIQKNRAFNAVFFCWLQLNAKKKVVFLFRDIVLQRSSQYCERTKNHAFKRKHTSPNKTNQYAQTAASSLNTPFITFSRAVPLLCICTQTHATCVAAAGAHRSPSSWSIERSNADIYWCWEVACRSLHRKSNDMYANDVDFRINCWRASKHRLTRICEVQSKMTQKCPAIGYVHEQPVAIMCETLNPWVYCFKTFITNCFIQFRKIL